MKYSNLVERIAGDGADAWTTHYAARTALDRGEDVIILSVGDPDLETPAPVVERAIESLRGGDTHYTSVAGRQPLREAIARSHRERTGQPVEDTNVIFLAGAQNALPERAMKSSRSSRCIRRIPQPSRHRALTWCACRARQLPASGRI